MVIFLQGIASRPSFVEQVNSEKVVLRIFFEGFPDLTMATMSFAEGAVIKNKHFGG
tara:strand:+ start:1222 stop:1389 length:168 start_codon:yes stop_codon:yes gene_type:complete